MNLYPTIHRDLSHVLSGPNQWVGIDWEWDRNENPTILGLSRNGEAGSVPFSTDCVEVLDRLIDQNVSWVGHNVIDADKPVVENVTGKKIPLEKWEDTLVLSYLCNAEFASIPKSTFGGDDENVDTDQKGIGLLNLWATASLYTSLPQWKKCRAGS